MRFSEDGPMARSTPKLARVVAATICMGASPALLFFFFMGHHFADDFAVYWRAANDPVAAAYLPREHFPFPYMPTMFLWIAPLKLVPMRVAYGLWSAIGMGAMWLAIRNRVPRPALVLVLLSPPAIQCFVAGQVSAVLAALMIVAFASGPVAAGVIFGCIASIKPQLVLFGPVLFLVRRQWLTGLWAATTFIALVTLSALLFGVPTWLEWYRSLDHFHAVVVTDFVLNVSANLAAFAEARHLAPLPFQVAGAIVGLGLIWNLRGLTDPLALAALVTVTSLLAAPYAMAYDLIAAMPLVAALAWRGRVKSSFALAGGPAPLPLLLIAYDLVSRRGELQRDVAASQRTAPWPSPSSLPLRSS